MLAACLVAAGGWGARALAVQASGEYAPAAAGFDISWPQCGGAYPLLAEGDFAVAGVTGGRPFTANPCLASEFAWASAGGVLPSLYVNLAFGLSANGPCSAVDPACRPYDYGWSTARSAFLQAWAATSGASLDTRVWWLDVETGNIWSGDRFANSMVVRGAVSFFHSVHREVGVYSVAPMWRGITGGYAPPGVPNWVAGASDGRDYSRCFMPLWPGASVSMYQYLPPGAQFDGNHSC
ncbi:MAG: hypothetical protein ACREPI_05755 [Candidatus Dormibacterales bacterium]